MPQRRRHVKAHIQPKKPEQICLSGKVQTYKHSKGTKFHSIRQLDDEYRFSSRLLPLTYRQESQTVPKADFLQSAPTNGLLALRDQFCSKSVCNNDELDHTTTEKRRISSTSVSKRLPFSKSGSSIITQPDNIRTGLAQRYMVTEPAASPLQFEGNARYYQCIKRSRSAPELYDLGHEMKQRNSFLPPQGRGNEIHSPDKTYLLNSNSTTQLYSPEYLPHLRKFQLQSRLSVTGCTLPSMASPSICYDSEGVQKVGLSGNRSTHITSGSRSSLHIARQNGRPSASSRCIQQNMDLPPSMGVSSITSEQRISELSDCPLHRNKSTLSSDRLIDRTTSIQSIRNDLGDMEMWGWSQHLTNWSTEQRELLSSSWRRSTLNTYRPALKRWIKWAKEQGIDMYNPSGSDFARFLADLHQKEKLSLSTILVHKSAFSTFVNPEGQEKLSSNSLVKQVLKAIALATPRPSKPPIWDTDILIRFLSIKATGQSEILEAAKRTATILLLCSGRRVHDLTLLRISPEYYSVSEDAIIFTPAFGSKTDTDKRRQSNWKLMPNEENNLLCPVYWVKHLTALTQERRSRAKSDCLFVTITGAPKPASRTIIGGWVKKLLNDAGIEATPGSLRSAVASKSWIENFQLEDILSRGNWKSANTFFRFYRRELTPSSAHAHSISALFSPTDD
ncbi:uncharacterized protein LOC132903384 [Amyelois transitella]|uniref:uncharacterized protein LOC132903384 n=1 Tax=Amyelois transitella TaxID=680683 RepID=UPI00298FDA2E|nr:uncharacterized protein LOC132903384 [Amyelois transitella]